MFSAWFPLLYVAFIFAKNPRRERVTFLHDFVGTALTSLGALAGAALSFSRPPSEQGRGYRVSV
jgi:4-hydroxybenzoate polyprenyltransferase